jgi:hypothetical protein
MNFSRPDLSSLPLQRRNIGICMRNHYSTYIKPPPNPSKRGKNGSKITKRNQTMDLTNVGERGNQYTYLGVTRKRSSQTTMKC